MSTPKFQKLEHERSKIYEKIVSHLANGYKLSITENRDRLENETEDLIENYMEAENDDEVNSAPNSLLEQMLSEYHEICEKILDNFEEQHGIGRQGNAL